MTDEEPPVAPEAAPAEPPAPVPPPEPRPEPAPRRGGFVLPLLGGALAAGLGFALSHFDVLDLRAGADAEVEARLAALDQAIGTATDQGARAAAEDAATKAEAALAETGRLQDLSARIEALEQALAAPGSGDAAALAALRAEVEALKAGGAPAADTRTIVQQELAAWQAGAAEQAAAEAEAAKAVALRDAALATLAEAPQNGAPYAAALAALALPEPPAVLAKHAETGLPTAASLAESFPEAARAALEASLRAAPDSGGFWSFLRLQTGARSLSPQQGSDPDAVLSRAEAAVHAGEIQAALDEIAALPAEGQQAMADWTVAAQDHLAARAAIATLSSAP